MVAPLFQYTQDKKGMEAMEKLKKFDNWLTKALKNTFMVVGILATIYWALELILKLLGK